LKLFDEVCARLDAASVPYALVGAAAMGVNGVARSTLDLDVLTLDPVVLEAAFWKGLPGTVRARRGDAEDPLAGAVRLESPDAYPVDVIVGRFAWQSRIVERAERLPVGRGRVPVVGAADLVLLKLFAGGAQDAWDVQQLLQVHRGAAAEVEARLPELPPEAAALWARVRGWEK
jgi:hypothetical protein